MFFRGNKRAVNETREGVTYSTGVDLQDTTVDSIEEISPPNHVPQISLVPLEDNDTEIFFDLEATGLGTILYI